jgi:hypothetical protein
MFKYIYKGEEPKRKELKNGGIYTATIKDAIETYSMAGNQMMKLKLNVDGVDVYDHLVFKENCHWKLEEFIRAAKLAKKAGDVVNFDAALLIGLKVKVKIKIVKKEAGEWPEVDRYLSEDDDKPSSINDDDNLEF